MGPGNARSIRLKCPNRPLRKRGLISMPKPEPKSSRPKSSRPKSSRGSPPDLALKPSHGHDQGIVRDAKGEEQPRDKARAHHVSRQDSGGDPPGQKN
jgi:hypothetical protein